MLKQTMHNASWITIAPICNLWAPPEAVQLPFFFSDDTSLRPLPEWITSENGMEIDQLRPRLRQAIVDKKITHCLTVEYQADSLGTPDPEWRGPEPRSIQDTALEKIHIVMLSMWLAQPTGMHFREIAHCVKSGQDWLVRQIGDHYRDYPLSAYKNEQMNSEDVNRAKHLSKLLFGMPTEGPVWSAICSTGLALTQHNWILRYLVFWLVLEALFGPEDPRETAFRISQRIAFFLADAGDSPHELFVSMKESYKWRSKIVHGVRLKKLKDEASEDLISNLELTARRSILRILENKSLTDIFSGKDRERYLDDLVFARR